MGGTIMSDTAKINISPKLYYKNHFPYLAQNLEYGKWYHDHDNLICIHPNGLPLYINLNKYCKWDDKHSCPIYIDYEFIDIIKDIFNNYRNKDIKCVDECPSIAFDTPLRASFRQLYLSKIRSTTKYITDEIDHIAVANSSTPLANVYGFYDVVYSKIYFHTEEFPVDASTYTISINKEPDEFEIVRVIYELLKKPWATKHHINLAFNIFGYLTNQNELKCPTSLSVDFDDLQPCVADMISSTNF